MNTYSVFTASKVFVSCILTFVLKPHSSHQSVCDTAGPRHTRFNMHMKAVWLNVISLLFDHVCLPPAGSYVWEHLEMGYVQGMCDLLAPLMVILDDGEI